MRNIFLAIIVLTILCMTTSAQVVTTDTSRLEASRGAPQGMPQPKCTTGVCRLGTQPTFYSTDSKPEDAKPEGAKPEGVKTEGEPRVNRQVMQQKVEQRVQSAPPPGNIPPPRNTASASSVKNTSPAKNLLFDEEVADSIEPGTIYRNTIEVLPETTTKVDLSSMDINRIVCPVDIKDVVYSKEKGLSVRIQGKNAFMKFVVARDDGIMKYNAVPVDVYVVCGNEVYSMIAYPKRIPAQVVRLSQGRRDAVKKNMEMFDGIPFEKKVMTALKAIFTDTIPDSFSIAVVNRPFNVFRQISLVLKRIITIEGEGIKVKEYIAQAKTDVYLREKDFLRPDLTTNTMAVSLSALNLKKDETSRILIVEQKGGD